MRELYVYWRPREGALVPALQAARAWHRELAARHPDLGCRLLERDDGARPTVMEIYARAAGIDAALEAELRRDGDARLAPWIDGARHVEVFVPARG